MTLEIQQVIPVLRIFDVEKAKEFYVGFLGFEVVWEHRFDDTAPVSMHVSRGGCVLHLTEHHGDCCPGSKVFLRVRGLEEYHKEISAKNYGYNRPGLERASKSKSVQVTDPFGNRVRFEEQL